MYKSTAQSSQFVTRTGSFSTRPSVRGVNLLGWEGLEEMTDEQKRNALTARAKSVQAQLNGPLHPAERKRLGKESFELNCQINALRPKRQGPRTTPEHFMDVARESLPKLQFQRYMSEASERARLAEQAQE